MPAGERVKRPTLNSKGPRKGGLMANRGGMAGHPTGTGRFTLGRAGGSIRRATRKLEGSARGLPRRIAPFKVRGTDFDRPKAIGASLFRGSRRGVTAVSCACATKAVITSSFLPSRKTASDARSGLRRGRAIT